MHTGKNDRISPPMNSEQISHTFSNLIMLGKTRSALQYLFRKADEGVLKVDNHIPSDGGRCTVRKALQELYPAGKDPSPEALRSDGFQHSLPTDPILFESPGWCTDPTGGMSV